MKKKTNYRDTLGSFEIHTKMGKERFLNEVAKWYEAMYPAKADFFRAALRNLRQVTNPGAVSVDDKGRETLVQIRVPTELWLFLKRWIPDFGDDSADIELLTRVWCDLVRPARDHRKHTRLYVEKVFPHVQLSQQADEAGKGAAGAKGKYDDADGAVRGTDGPGVGDDHREGLCGESEEDSCQPPSELRPTR